MRRERKSTTLTLLEWSTTGGCALSFAPFLAEADEERVLFIEKEEERGGEGGGVCLCVLER